jgi:hypothetical protein
MLGQSGKAMFLDKTPAYGLVLPFLAKLYPRARYVVLTRHPLAVLSSYAGSFFEGDYDAAVAFNDILGRYVPGNVFMFVSRGWMSYRQGLDVDRVSAGMVYEQVLNVAGALVVTAALFPFWHYERRVTAWALLAIPVIVIALHPRVFAPLAALLLRVLHRPPLTRVLSLRVVLGLLAAFAGLWLVAGLALWAFAAAVTNVTAAAFPQITAGFAVAFVVGMVIFFVPSGIGVREGVLAAATASVFAGGGIALAWALLARLWQTALEIGFVAAATLADRVRRRAAQAHGTEVGSDERARQAAAPREHGDDA